MLYKYPISDTSACLSQLCEAYETFMFDVAKLIRLDRGLEVNETVLREEVKEILQLEQEMANVSVFILFIQALFVGAGSPSRLLVQQLGLSFSFFQGNRHIRGEK